jgi:ribosome-associated heat shock protein Hsp15
MTTAGHGDAREPVVERLRLDKWLWAARFYRTRSQAAQAIETGQARIGETRVKPAHPVRAGDRVSVRKAGLAWEVTVQALSDRRGSATEAARLYVETASSLAAREQALATRKSAPGEPRFTGRPTKRDRRKLEDFLGEP